MIKDADEERYCQSCGQLYYRRDRPNFALTQWRELRTCGNDCGAKLSVVPAIIRFWERVSPEPNSGCWLWDGGFYKSGYGYFYNGKVVQGAHRFSFEYFKRPLSLDENVCHSCDMPMCVNPDRLWAGTQADNMADKHLKGRAPLGEKHGGNKLTDEAVRIGRRENMSPSAFALRFHVNSSTAHSALRGKTWKHVK